jgi:CIC family chloride channel protein
LSGAAVGIVAAFKAPLTGIPYALEIPYKSGIEASAFPWSVPTALTAYVVSQLLIEPHIRIKPVRCYVAVDANVILISIAIGLASAALALLFIASMSLAEKASKKLEIAVPVALGVALALLALLFPKVRGFGYETINNVISNTVELSAAQLIVLALVKTISTALTVRGGGSEGVFLPTIFVGVVFGAGLAKILSSLGVETCGELILALAVSSLLAATSKTLLTSVALTVEVFGFINAIPSLLAATIAYIVTLKWSLIKGQQMSRTNNSFRQNILCSHEAQKFS